MAGTKKEKRLKRGWLGHLKKINVSSPFGTRWGRFHGGIDLSVAVGTQIYAPFDGTLTCKFQKGRPPGNDGKGEIVGAGLYAVLKKGSLEMQFMHLSSCVVSEGSSTSVSEGQPIGKTGGKKWERNSGNSRGPHLHLTVKQDGKKITLDYKNASKEELAAFMGEALPNYDRDRVYPADMKKLAQWYNILVENDVTDFDEPTKETTEE